MLPVSEVFYSIQGEGSTMGFPAIFLRLGGCNLMCGGMGTQFDKKLYNGATWRCDTIEVWMKSKQKKYEDILSSLEIEALKNNAHLIITGGEPLMHQEKIIEFIEWFFKEYCFIPNIEIETNGTIAPYHELAKDVYQFNCSPKLTNSGNSKSVFFNHTAIKIINGYDSIFKFVVSSGQDWEEIKETYLPIIKRDKIWLMPSGENQKLLSESKQIVAEICKKEYLKFTDRLHIEIWNKKTGV